MEGRKAALSLHVSLALPLTRHFGPSDDSPQIYAFSAALLTTNITCSRDLVRTQLLEPIFLVGKKDQQIIFQWMPRKYLYLGVIV